MEMIHHAEEQERPKQNEKDPATASRSQSGQPQNKHQFEEVVARLLGDQERQKTSGVFY